MNGIDDNENPFDSIRRMNKSLAQMLKPIYEAQKQFSIANDLSRVIEQVNSNNRIWANAAQYGVKFQELSGIAGLISKELGVAGLRFQDLGMAVNKAYAEPFAKLQSTLALAMGTNYLNAFAPTEVFSRLDDLTSTIADELPQDDHGDTVSDLLVNVGPVSSKQKFTWRDVLAILSFLIAIAPYVENALLKKNHPTEQTNQIVQTSIVQTVNYTINCYQTFVESVSPTPEDE